MPPIKINPGIHFGDRLVDQRDRVHTVSGFVSRRHLQLALGGLQVGAGCLHVRLVANSARNGDGAQE